MGRYTGRTSGHGSQNVAEMRGNTSEPFLKWMLIDSMLPWALTLFPLDELSPLVCLKH